MATNHIFSNLLQQVLIGFSKWVEFGAGRSVETNIRQIRKCTPELQHVNSFFCDKKQAFFALLRVLGQRLCCCTSVKSL